MVTYEQIKAANDQVEGIDVKGKEYVMVNQRIKAFRMVYPNGPLLTEPVKLTEDEAIFKAECFNEEGVLLARAHARELRTSSFINKTSYIENCETSALGRALGFCGFGIDTSVASAEEVQNAQLQQNDKPSERDIASLNAYCTEEQIQALLNAKNVENVEDLPADYVKKAVAKAKRSATVKAKKDNEPKFYEESEETF